MSQRAELDVAVKEECMHLCLSQALTDNYLTPNALFMMVTVPKPVV